MAVYDRRINWNRRSQSALQFLALDQEQCDGTILATELFLGGLAERLKRAGLEIRIQDFGLNWTVSYRSALTVLNSVGNPFQIRSVAARSAPKSFLWVTFAGYLFGCAGKLLIQKFVTMFSRSPIAQYGTILHRQNRTPDGHLKIASCQSRAPHLPD